LFVSLETFERRKCISYKKKGCRRVYYTFGFYTIFISKCICDLSVEKNCLYKLHEVLLRKNEKTHEKTGITGTFITLIKFGQEREFVLKSSKELRKLF